MRIWAARNVPIALKQIRGRLERWRRTRRGRDRIPEELWRLAVQAVSTYGLNKSARALGLDYYSLKKRVEASPARCGSKAPGGTTFVELAPLTRAERPASPVSGFAPEGLLELERVDGAKLRIHLKGIAVPDLVALSRSFWSAEV